MANFVFSHSMKRKEQSMKRKEQREHDMQMKLCEAAINEVNVLYDELLALPDEEILSNRTQRELEQINRILVKLAKLYMSM